MEGHPAAAEHARQVPRSEAAGRRESPADSSCVRGVVLAGVHAWGNCVLEEVVPRPLLPVAARPIIWHILSWIREGGVGEASVCGNSDTSVLRRSLGAGRQLGVAVEYSEDAVPRGPAGCARDAALATGAETLVVIDGTIIPCVDLAALLRVHAQAQAAATLVVAGGGSTNGHPHPEQEPLGIYVFSRSALEKVPATGYRDIKEWLIPELHRCGECIVAHAVPAGLVPRVADAASYLAVSMWAVERMVRSGSVPDGYAGVDDARIASSARVDPTVQLVGPVLVGPGCVLEPEAMIVGPTTIGSDCTIERGAVVSRSVIWDRCRIGADAVLDRCILTHEAAVDPAVALREIVYVPPGRSRRSFLDRLASCLRPVGGRRRSAAHADHHRTSGAVEADGC